MKQIKGLNYGVNDKRSQSKQLSEKNKILEGLQEEFIKEAVFNVAMNKDCLQDVQKLTAPKVAKVDLHSLHVKEMREPNYVVVPRIKSAEYLEEEPPRKDCQNFNRSYLPNGQ